MVIRKTRVVWFLRTSFNGVGLDTRQSRDFRSTFILNMTLQIYLKRNYDILEGSTQGRNRKPDRHVVNHEREIVRYLSLLHRCSWGINLLSFEIATELSARWWNFDGNSRPRFVWKSNSRARLKKQARLEKQGNNNKAERHDRSSLELGFRSISLPLGAKHAEHRDRY